MAHLSDGIRFGLIGCGGIGQLRAESIARSGVGRLVAVSDLNADRAGSLATKCNAVLESNWEVLVRRPDIDAIIVSTPPSMHAEMAELALLEGRHVLCEKPLARNPSECQRVVEAAQRSGRFLATGFNYRFFPSVLAARNLIDSGAIGELNHIRAYTGYSAAEHNQMWIRDPEMMGGGTLRDNGIHLIDLTRYFLGEVAETKGFASENVWGFTGCEDNAFALLRAKSGSIASLQASWTEWRKYHLELILVGTRGCIEFSCFPMRTSFTQVSELGGKSRRRSYRFPFTQLREHLWSYRILVVDSFILELRAFASELAGRRTAIATGVDGLAAVEIADAVYPGRSSDFKMEPSTIDVGGFQ